MKTKLLKKIRKRFVIYYYKNGVNFNGDYFKDNYLLLDKYNDFHVCIGSKDKCIEYMLSVIRYEYKQYSRKYKQNKPIKVWWNG